MNNNRPLVKHPGSQHQHHSLTRPLTIQYLQFFPSTITIPYTSLQSIIRITTSTFSVTTITSTTSTLSIHSTIVHSTPQTSCSQLAGNPKPISEPRPLSTNKIKPISKDSLNSISNIGQKIIPSTSRPRRQPSPYLVLNTLVSLPPPHSSPASDAEFESEYAQAAIPTLYPRVIVDNPDSDSELNPPSQYQPVKPSKHKRNRKSASKSPPNNSPTPNKPPLKKQPPTTKPITPVTTTPNT